MPTFTLKDPKKMGDHDPKYGQSYWAYTHESQLPVKFNLMEGTVSDGQKITCEEAATKTSSKGTDYQQLRKVKPFTNEEQPAQTSFKPAYQPREDHHEAIKAQWAIGQAVSVYKDKVDEVETYAKTLFKMVDRVKADEPTQPKQDTPVSNEEMDSLINSGEPINLDDIPF